VWICLSRRRTLHPPIYRFLEMRQELGARNIFHPIARLLNPARAASQVIGCPILSTLKDC